MKNDKIHKKSEAQNILLIIMFILLFLLVLIILFNMGKDKTRKKSQTVEME